MPANLNPQYYAAEEAYKNATTNEEKIKALQEMLSAMPKHKGTEKLQGDIKRRLAKLRKEEKKKPKASQQHNPFVVKKQGAGQVVLAGYPNVGKSSMIAALSRAQVNIAPHPFSTSIPQAGMMPYEDIHIQLIDTPPINFEGTPPELFNTFQAADLLAVLIDASSDDCLDQLDGSLQLLRSKNIISSYNKEQEELEKFSSSHRFVPFIIIASKMDLEESNENLQVLKELHQGLSFFTYSIHFNEEKIKFKQTIFDNLEINRVYTKAPGEKADLSKPFVLKKGETVLDLAEQIHNDFYERLKNARVWGSARFAGQVVSRDYVLHDGDIVELNVSG